MSRVRLPRLPACLRSEGFACPAYRVLHDRAVDGAFPAEQAPTGLWYFDDENVPEIAQALGLQRIAVGSDRTRRHQPAAA
jgi:hypothetical protein